MKTHDKYQKAGTLSFQLQKYQNNPKYQDLQNNEALAQIPSQEIHVPHVKKEVLQSSPKSNRQKSKSKDKHVQKSSTIKFTSSPSNVEPQDEDQLFEQCLNLTSRIQTFKKQKYEQVIQEYEEEERKKLEYLYSKHKQQVHSQYQQKRKQLRLVYQKESSKINKSLEQTKKYKEAYLSILEDLNQKKKKLNEQYNVSVEKVKSTKSQLIAQWKRNSNEQIIRCLKNV